TAGTLELRKSAVVNAVAGSSLSVFTGGAVRWFASDQVADTVPLNINGSTSTMDLNGFSDTVGVVSMTGGTLASGAGTLHLAANVTSTASTASATISGNFDLGATATRTFTVADGTAADDLIVSANVSGTAAISKAGS